MVHPRFVFGLLPEEDWDGTNTKFLYAFNSESRRFENGTDVISLELLNNQNHIVLLWAQNADTWVKEKESDDIDLRNITYPSDMKLSAENADKYAAFYAVKFIPSTERVNNGKIELTRPFAQINIATADPGKYNVNVEKTVVTVNGDFVITEDFAIESEYPVTSIGFNAAYASNYSKDFVNI